MARYLDVHPENPQPRLLQQVVDALRDDALIAYPTKPKRVDKKVKLKKKEIYQRKNAE